MDNRLIEDNNKISSFNSIVEHAKDAGQTLKTFSEQVMKDVDRNHQIYCGMTNRGENR